MYIYWCTFTYQLESRMDVLPEGPQESVSAVIWELTPARVEEGEREGWGWWMVEHTIGTPIVMWLQNGRGREHNRV